MIRFLLLFLWYSWLWAVAIFGGLVLIAQLLALLGYGN